MARREMGARYPGPTRRYQHQYGNLIVTAWSEHGIYYVTVLQPDTGYEVTIETADNNPLEAARFALQWLAGGIRPDMSNEWAEAVQVLGQDAEAALREIDEIEFQMEGTKGPSLGATTPKRVLDRNFQEIRPGQKVVVQWPYYYINIRRDEGIVDRTDEYGGVTIRTDHPVPHYDQQGFQVHSEPWIYFPTRYDYDRRVHVAASKVGDPFEHGQTDTYIEIIGNPGSEMGAARYQIECNFECPGGKKEQFPIWPRKGEKTMDETCIRGLREWRHLDEAQIALCKKGIHKRLY